METSSVHSMPNILRHCKVEVARPQKSLLGNGAFGLGGLRKGTALEASTITKLQKMKLNAFWTPSVGISGFLMFETKVGEIKIC